MTPPDSREAEFLENPVLFVELASEWAAGGPEPTAEHQAWLSKLDRPLILHAAAARPALWGVLSSPERGRALAWLDRTGILVELLPCWGGEYFRQAMRLQAVEEVHLEKWANGLESTVFDWLCIYMDEQVDGRLGGWAVTGLATLLLSGDEPAETFVRRVDRDLKTLGANEGERTRVTTAIREYPELYEVFTSGRETPMHFSPTGIVATLCTLLVLPYCTADTLTQAIRHANRMLMKYAA